MTDKKFTRLSDYRFKQDASGNTVFYPFGKLGKGYVLESESQERIAQITSNLSFYVVIILISLYTLHYINALNALVIALAVEVINYFFVRTIFKNNRVSDEKLTFSDFFRSAKLINNKKFLLLIAAVFFSFSLLLGYLVFVQGQSAGLRAMCVFIFGTLFTGYFLAKKGH